MIVGKVRTANGQDADIVVGAGDGGVVPVNDMQHKGDAKYTVSNNGPYGTYGPETSAPSVVGFGNAAPPSYQSGSGVGESIEGQRVGGGYPPEKTGTSQPQWR